MPPNRHPDFETIYRNFIEIYGEEKGEEYYRMWLNKYMLDETKPIEPQLQKFRREWRISFEKFRLDVKPLRIRGYAIHAGATRNWNLYLETELKKAAQSLIGVPVYLEHVDVNNAVGKVVNAYWDEDERAIVFEAEIYDDEVADKIRAGVIKHVSIAADYELIDYLDGIRVPRNLRFCELSLVAVPGDPHANIMVIEKLVCCENMSEKKQEKVEEKGKEKEEVSLKEVKEPNIEAKPTVAEKPEPKIEVEPAASEPQANIDVGPEAQVNVTISLENYNNDKEVAEAVPPKHKTPKAPEEREWDKTAAITRIRKWASSDGSGDKDKIDWRKYRMAFAWYDENDPENFGSYKLPHHDVIDGKLVVVWRGVAAAMAALMGARGGVNIPAKDRRAVYEHLRAHYEQFDKEPPEFKEMLEVSDEVHAPHQLEEPQPTVAPTSAVESVGGKKEVEKVEGEEKMEKVEEKAGKGVVMEEKDPILKTVKDLREAVSIGTGVTQVTWKTEIEAEPIGLIANLRSAVRVVQVTQGDRVRIRKITVPEFAQLTKGTEPSDTTWTVSAVEVTLNEYGLVGTIDYQDIEDLGEELIRAINAGLAKAAKLKEDEVILSTLKADTNITEIYGGDATDVDSIDSADTFTADLVLKALKTIADNGYDVTPSDLVLVLSPKQWHDLNNSLQWFKDASKAGVAGGKVVMDSIMGIPIVLSSKVPTTENAGGVTCYHAFLMRRDAVVLAPKRELLVETQKEIGKRQLKIVATHRFGVDVLFDKAIVEIITA
ncbi:hypothetical protein DRJ17_04505 [Candidatus Woesearchaeota archaeon]|nr:MAG: hypothetical protein DRJ17_04505 [Candidatus Woesearchaeota archaeon]